MGFMEWQADAADWLDAHINPFHNAFGPSANERKKAAAGGPQPTQGPLAGPLESTMSGLAWFRDNVISRPITTLELMIDKSIGNPQGNELVSGDEWKKSWNAAAHISPAQALLYKPTEDPGVRNRELENAPLEYKRPEALPQGFDQLPWDQQQDLLKGAGMPVQGNAAVEAQRRASDLFKYGSGAGDFALSWYLDPLVLGGKVAGAAKTRAIVRPVDATWSGAKIDQEMNRSVMLRAQDFIFANRDNPQLLNNLSMARSSAMGPRFGAIASTLKTPEEVNLFLRVGLGDTRAMDELATRNAMAAQIIEQDTARLPNLGLMRSKYTNNPNLQSLVDREMERATNRLNANVDMMTRYTQVLDAAHEIDKINLTRYSFERAEAETAAQNAYAAGAARRAGTADRSFVAQRSIGTAGNPMARPVADRLPGGGSHAVTRVVGNFFSTPLTVIRSFGEYRPTGHMNIQTLERDSINELRGFVSRIPGMTPVDRQRVINSYLTTANEGERMNLLEGLEREAMRGIAKRHGFTTAEADAIYATHQAKQSAEKAALKGDAQYSTVKMPGAEPGARVRVDAFPDGTGAYKIHPNLVTRLINEHQMIDLEVYDKVLGRNAHAMQALRWSHAKAGNAADWVESAGDWLNSAWKFGTLLRLGYIPRVLGDDLGGQIARLGAASMALRAGWGVKNAATNVARSFARPQLMAKQAAHEQGIAYANDELKILLPQIQQMEQMDIGLLRSNRKDLATAQARVARAQARVDQLPETAATARQAAAHAAARTLLTRHEAALRQAQMRMGTGLSIGKARQLNDMRIRKNFLEDYRSLSEKAVAQAVEDQQKVVQGIVPVDLAPGLRVPGALSGQRGQMYQALVSSEASLDSIFKTNKQLVHGNLMRSWNHGATTVNATADPAGHLDAWQHVINAQFANDALARRALAGDSVKDLTRWLTRTAEGIAYRRRLGEGLTSADDLARRAHYDVNEVAATPEIRAAALTPEGVTAEQLERQFPNLATRPDVHRGQLAANLLGGNQYRQGLNKIMESWFKWAAAIPSDRMSRHPLFNQLYEGHARRIADQEVAQGRTLTTANDAERIAESARRLALRDTRRLVFDIAHQSDAAAALKYISPFFSATTESWQRWSRIIADKPEVAGYGVKFFNAPLAAGVMQDKDGNKIDAEGYVNDPVTGERRLTTKGDRRIVMRLPKFLVEGHNPIGLAFGASPAGDINLSQDSMNLVLAGDPWFNPGQGPIVTIPLNEFIRDKPELAEIAQHIGTLPFGPSNEQTFVGRLGGQLLPRTAKDFLTAFDTSDGRYQNVKAQVLQRAAFEHANFGKEMPSAQEIADRTRNYWLFSAASAFLGPIAGQTNDPYQFYRDEYNKMSRSVANKPKDELGRPIGKSADDMFLDKYGESYFVFAQAMTKNTTGLPPTMKAALLSQKYGDLIADDPSLAALIVGPDGAGPFSSAAYSYQLNNPLVPGGSEMQRIKLSADEAMTENEKRLGWAKYTARMNELNAQLVKRGLKSFNDEGAEDLKLKKQGFTSLYSKPLYPDGTVNPYYIEAWAQDFNTLNPQRYNAMIPALTNLARSELAEQPLRSDLRILQEYLGARQAMNGLLSKRRTAGGSASLTASKNADLRDMWERKVQDLVLSDTSFGDLYHRYLSRDMEIDIASRLESEGLISGS